VDDEPSNYLATLVSGITEGVSARVMEWAIGGVSKIAQPADLEANHGYLA
jgi:hypothetical protein